jgi:hypothetical protein
MLDAGMDPRYAARRLVRMASEDIGLADPRALAMCLDAAAAFERLGSPEGELALAQAAAYLAVAPKSNAVYKAWGALREQVGRDGTHPVPMHLRNAPTALMKSLGVGTGYRYAHDEEEGYAAGETYLPPHLAGRRYYEPLPRGLELRIADKLAELRRRDAEGGEEGGGQALLVARRGHAEAADRRGRGGEEGARRAVPQRDPRAVVGVVVRGIGAVVQLVARVRGVSCVSARVCVFIVCEYVCVCSRARRRCCTAARCTTRRARSSPSTACW